MRQTSTTATFLLLSRPAGLAVGLGLGVIAEVAKKTLKPQQRQSGSELCFVGNGVCLLVTAAVKECLSGPCVM